jgi:hypothetical protein
MAYNRFNKSEYKSDTQDNLKKIAGAFGKPKDDPIINNGDSIIYKGEKLKIVNSKFPLPANKNDITDLIRIVKSVPISGNMTIDDYSNHEDVEGSPYEDCYSYLTDLLVETRMKLREYINKLEDDNFEKRLEKPNFMAFYRPFHFWPETWGIYMNLSALQRQASRIYNYNVANGTINGFTYDDAISLSFFKTYYHEMFHHKIELFGTKMEIAMRKPVYDSSFHKFYCETYGTDYCLEEAFANVYGLRKSIQYLKEKNLISYNETELRNLLRESVLRDAPMGYRVSYEISSVNDPDREKYFENKFLEILIDFTHRIFNNNIPPLPIEVDTWNLFTYKLDPLINTKNNVTFYMP